MEAFEQYCTELEQFFAELTVKQLGGGAAEGGEEPADGEEQPKPDGEGAEAAAEAKEEHPEQAEGEAQDAGEKGAEAS